MHKSDENTPLEKNLGQNISNAASDPRGAFPVAEHPLRSLLSDEIRARPYELLKAPASISYLAMLTGEDGYHADFNHLSVLCNRFGVAAPEPGAIHYSNHFQNADCRFRLKWERHSEFCAYTFSTDTPLDADDPFAANAIDQVPHDWLKSIPGMALVAHQVVIEPRDAPERTTYEIAELLDGNIIAASFMSRRRARVWTDFQLHADGFNRILIRDDALDTRSGGRLVQRLLEIGTYRMLALLGLPIARAARPEIRDIEQALGDIIASLATSEGLEEERRLLQELSDLAARIEKLTSDTSYRMSATAAYYDLVKRRVEDVREKRMEGLQPPAEFVNKRLVPAMQTCANVVARQDNISGRIARATALLRTRVDVKLEEQNRDLLASMDRRARIQLRLQETVEGLSVVAISYYLVGLVLYAAKGAKAYYPPIDSDIAAGISLPFIVIAVWMGVRRLRRALAQEKTPPSQND